MNHQRDPVWRNASNGDGSCVDVAQNPEAPAEVLVRDSKDPDGPRLRFTGGDFAALLGALKTGHLDR